MKKGKSKRKPYDCEDARTDILFYFSATNKTGPEYESALWRFSHHVAKISKFGRISIACKDCRKYYQKTKRVYSKTLHPA